MLDAPEAEVVKLILGTVSKVLMAGEKEDGENDYADQFESVGGLKKLESLQLHPNREIYDAALKVMKQHFEVDEVGSRELDLGRKVSA